MFRRDDLAMSFAQIVAVGSCNHKDICARCSLLMRLNYDDTACPFCKTELSQVSSTLLLRLSCCIAATYTHSLTT